MRIPKTLLNDVRKLADRFEQVVRQDERKRLLAKFRAETNKKPVAKPLYPVTGLHGDPLQEAAPVPVKTVAQCGYWPGPSSAAGRIGKGLSGRAYNGWQPRIYPSDCGPVSVRPSQGRLSDQGKKHGPSGCWPVPENLPA